MLSRRAALQLAISSASAALLAACGSAAAPPASAPTPPPQAAPKPTTATAPSAPTALATAPPSAAPTSSTGIGLQAAPTPVPPSQARLGGTLRIGMVGDITALDPFVWSPNNSNTVGQVHDQLVTYDETFPPKPRQIG